MPLKMQAELSVLLFLTHLLMCGFHMGHFSLLGAGGFYFAFCLLFNNAQSHSK